MNGTQFLKSSQIRHLKQRITHLANSHGLVVQPNASKMSSFSEALVVSLYRWYAKSQALYEPSRMAVQ